MMDQLIAAARQARVESSGERLIDIVIVEEGLIVRGLARRPTGTVTHTVAIDWPEMESPAPIVLNAVRLIARLLSHE